MPRPPIAISGAPPNRGIPPNRPLAGAALRLVLGNVAAARRISGAAVAQPCGTDNPPTMGAWPIPADIAGAPSGPAADTRAGAADTSGKTSDAAASGAAEAAPPIPIAAAPQTLPMMPPSAPKPSVVATAVATSESEGSEMLDCVAADDKGDASACSDCGAADIS